MRKLPLILAGAALFDLGVVVASSQAAQNDYFLKLDGMHTASACVAHGGQAVANDTQCKLPDPGPKGLKVKFTDLLVTSKTGSAKNEMKGSTWLVGVQADAKTGDAKKAGGR